MNGNPEVSPDQPWRTRADLLAARAEAVPRLERRALSVPRTLVEISLVAVASYSLPMAGAAFGMSGVVDDGVGVGLGVTFVLVGVSAAFFTARSGMKRHRWVRDLLAWDVAERAGRSLPPGAIRPEERTPWDARDDADFDLVARRLSAAAYTRPWRTGLLVRCLSVWGVVVGPLLILLGFMSPDAPIAFRVCAGLAGAWCLLCGAVGVFAAMRLAFRWTRLWRAMDRDIREIRQRRAGRRGEPSSPR